MRREKVPLLSKHDLSRLNVHSLRNTLNTSTLPYQRISEYATKATSSPRMANSSIAFLWEDATCFVVNREYGHFNSFHSFSGHSHIKNRTKPIILFRRNRYLAWSVSQNSKEFGCYLILDAAIFCRCFPSSCVQGTELPLHFKDANIHIFPDCFHLFSFCTLFRCCDSISLCLSV